MQSMEERDHSSILMTHDLINKLSAIVGHCDLLLGTKAKNSEDARRLTLILDLATRAAADLKVLQSKLGQRIRNATNNQQGNVA